MEDIKSTEHIICKDERTREENDYYVHFRKEIKHKSAEILNANFSVGLGKDKEKRKNSPETNSDELDSINGGVRRTRTADLFDVNEAL